MNSKALVDLDALRNSLGSTIHMVSIIQSAAENNVFSDEKDVPEALFCVWERLWDIHHQFSAIIDAEFQKKRDSK